MKTTNSGSARYDGLGKDGKGHVSTQSGALKDQPYGFQTRFEDAAGTNPEELIAAAHASCFTMALSFKLAEAGHSDGSVETDAEVTTDLQDGAEPVDPAGGPLSYGAGLIEREGYATAPLEELTSENLTGAPAYDSTDDHIGEVSEIILSDSGEVSSVIVDVGGFLGIGEKPVQLELSQIDILRTEGGGDIRVYISMTEEELKAMPDYEG